MKPSEIHDTEWLNAFHPSLSTSTHFETDCSKWLIFFSPEFVDEWWDKIKTATEAGELGPFAKVSTRGYIRGNRHVVQVYAREVEGVREKLREMGVTWRISYKMGGKVRLHV